MSDIDGAVPVDIGGVGSITGQNSLVSSSSSSNVEGGTPPLTATSTVQMV